RLWMPPEAAAPWVSVRRVREAVPSTRKMPLGPLPSTVPPDGPPSMGVWLLSDSSRGALVGGMGCGVARRGGGEGEGVGAGGGVGQADRLAEGQLAGAEVAGVGVPGVVHDEVQ